MYSSLLPYSFTITIVGGSGYVGTILTKCMLKIKIVRLEVPSG